MTITRIRFSGIVPSVVIICLIIGLTSNQFWNTYNAGNEKFNAILGTDQSSSTVFPMREDNLINHTVSGPIYLGQGFETYLLDLGPDVSMIVAYMECTKTFTLSIWGDSEHMEATFPESDNLTIVDPPERHYMVDVSWKVSGGTYNLTLLVFIRHSSMTSTNSSSQIISSTITTSSSQPNSSTSKTSDNTPQNMWSSLIAPSITVASFAIIGAFGFLLIWHRHKMVPYAQSNTNSTKIS